MAEQEPAAAAPVKDNAAAADQSAAAAPAGDNAAAAAGTALNGSGANGEADFTASLSDENRELWKSKGWKDANSALKSYKELQTEFSSKKSLTAPAADADQATLDAFYDQIGRPKDIDGYTFGVPVGVPADMPYDAYFATQFKTWSHQAGLTPKQAAVLHDAYVTETASKLAQMREETNGKITTAHGELTKAWGQPESEGYKRNVELARRAVANLDLGASFKSVGLIDPATGMVTDTKLALALARVGTAQFGEDVMYSGPAGNINNPFSDKTLNVTQQAQLVKNDPARAAILIRAAGQKPEEYGLRP